MNNYKNKDIKWEAITLKCSQISMIWKNAILMKKVYIYFNIAFYNPDLIPPNFEKSYKHYYANSVGKPLSTAKAVCECC